LIKDLSTTLILAQSQLKERYRNTAAGLAWVILNPVIMFGVQAIAFKHILKLDIDNYYLYLLTGLTPWIFIIMTLQMATPVLQTSGPILKAFKLNPIILILSKVLDNLLNFIIAFSLLYIPVQSLYGAPSWSVLLSIIPLILMVIGTSAMCTSLALTQVFYRDTNYVVTFATGVLFFITPVYFTAEMILPNYTWILNFHLPYLYIDAFRSCFYKFELNYFLIALGKSILATIFLLLNARWSWNRNKNELYIRI
tara:strand:- start:310 stop:1068 length:759 start_codon:yes stop_codon:yes gene_type:complete